MVVSVRLVGVTRRMMRESSLMVAIKTRMKPEIDPVSVRGRMIFQNRFAQEAPATTADSSSSPATWSMEEIPDRAEKGRFLAIQTITRRKKLPYSEGMGP